MRFPLLKATDPRLRLPAKPMALSTFATKSFQSFLGDMFETMYSARAGALGLAAPQIGRQMQAFILNLHPERHVDGQWFFGNPEILDRDGEIDSPEGCLNLAPGVIRTVKRASRVKVRALNRYGQEYEIEARDLFAIVIQHEMDHLRGVLITDL